LPKVLGNFLDVGEDHKEEMIFSNGSSTFINGSYKFGNMSRNSTNNKVGQSDKYGDMAKMIGFLVSLKSITQLVSNLIVGPMISK